MTGDLARIEQALHRALATLRPYTPGEVAFEHKAPGDPVTEADTAVNTLLHGILPRPDDGWLSEETTDDPGRLTRDRVWIVDPLDGTREFVQGIPEWCVSIGLAVEGAALAGGICNPATGEIVLGSRDTGVTLNGAPVRLEARSELDGAVVLASRSEVTRGEWERFAGAGFEVKALGSVAYKLGLVAAGLADATWTLVPKNEWDIAAGVALVQAAGGEVRTLQGAEPVFNRPDPLLDGLIATRPGLYPAVAEYLHL